MEALCIVRAAPCTDAGGGWLRGAPFTDAGRVWQPVVTLVGGVPIPSRVLARCESFLVDGECGRGVGVVEEVMHNGDREDPVALVVVQGWGRHRVVLPVAAVVELAPGERRLTVACPTGHASTCRRQPVAARSRPARSASVVAVTRVWARLAARLGAGRPGR
jgi:hypothetical protein